MLIASPVKPIGAGWVPSGRIMLTAPVGRAGGPMTYLNMAAVMSLNCSMMDMPSGSFGCGVFRSMLLATQTFSFESKARARTPIPARKLSTLVGSFGREPDDRVRRGVGDPDAILVVDDDVEGRLQPRDLYDAAVLDPSAGKEQQLVVRAIGNPDIAVRGDTDAHQSEEFFLEREIAFRADRLAVEIHHENFPVEAGDPDAVFRHGSAPADAINAHAGEAGDRRGERGSVGSELAPHRRRCSC